MVALVRAGVTATCSSADKPRYGDLDVDSNLPDARIALGGPDQNAFTAAVLAAADPAYAEELKRQLVRHRHGPGVGARRGAAGDGVGARRRPARRAGAAGARHRQRRRRSATRSPRWSTTSPTPRSPSTSRRRRSCEPFEERTVAVLNRGVPSFAVDTDGTLHTSLMRSCTGWPSGVWIDPQPRRTAPDGSNFQLQHWTHTFDYALVAGDGDWRTAAIPARSAEFAHPLLAVVGGADAAGGLPALGLAVGDRARRVRPARRAEGGGQPAASGSSQAVDPTEAVAVRLVETCGTTTDVVITSGLHRLSAASRVDLLEQSRLQKHRAFEGLTPARLRDRHRADPTQHAAGARRRPRASWHPMPKPRNRSTRGTGCTTAAPRRWAGCPRSRTCTRIQRRRARMSQVRAAAYRGQRLHRLGAARHGAAGVPRRLDGRARRACRSCCRAGEHLEADVDADDAAGHRAGALPGPRPTRRHRRRRGVDARVVAAGRRGRRRSSRSDAGGARRRGAPGRRARRTSRSPPARRRGWR